MSEKIYLHFLILCGIFCAEIITTLSVEDSRESSDFLVRTRRVISHVPGALNRKAIEDANYVVTIKENANLSCVGVILFPKTVITAASCVQLHVSVYKILSGSAYVQRSIVHNVISKREYFGNLPHNRLDGIALLTVHPLFEFGPKTGNIRLYNEPLRTGTLVTVFGWGCNYPPQRAPPGSRRSFNSITLPIMNNAECQNIYRDNINDIHTQNALVISEKHICTYHPLQYCARTDTGAPLVVNNRLAGIHVFKGEFAGKRNPDVFIDLQRDDYSTWIRNNARSM